MDAQGNRQIYFGGAFGDPLGDGHGHYTLSPSGRVIYRREPNQQRGPQNFTDYQPPKERPAAVRPQSRPPAFRPILPQTPSATPDRRGADAQRRDREERVRREQAQQAARAAAEAAADKKRREEDTPRIAAQAQAEADAATQRTRESFDQLLGDGMYDGVMQELARRQAAREAAARGQEVPTASPDVPTAEERKLTTHFRPTPDADPSPPARVGSGKKWEAQKDREMRLKLDRSKHERDGKEASKASKTHNQLPGVAETHRMKREAGRTLAAFMRERGSTSPWSSLDANAQRKRARELARFFVNEWEKTHSTKPGLQSESGARFEVQVSDGFDVDHVGAPVTDFKIIDRSASDGLHWHFGIGLDGKIAFFNPEKPNK